MNTAWNRPELPVRRPDRAMGGIYRSAETVHAGTTIGGVPMQQVSDAVVATVQLGYKVADRQIERTRRLARNLRGAAARAGADDPEQWVDQTERLLAKALTSGLEWMETAAAGDESPVRRLARAEWKLLRRLLRAAGVGEPPAADADAGAAAVGAPPSATAAPALDIRLDCAAPQDRRAVQLVRAQWSALPPEPLALWFHPRAAGADACIEGTVQREGGRDRLTLKTLRSHAAGAWRAAVCRADGEQLGWVEIEL